MLNSVLLFTNSLFLLFKRDTAIPPLPQARLNNKEIGQLCYGSYIGKGNSVLSSTQEKVTYVYFRKVFGPGVFLLSWNTLRWTIRSGYIPHPPPFECRPAVLLYCVHMRILLCRVVQLFFPLEFTDGPDMFEPETKMEQGEHTQTAKGRRMEEKRNVR